MNIFVVVALKLCYEIMRRKKFLVHRKSYSFKITFCNLLVKLLVQKKSIALIQNTDYVHDKGNIQRRHQTPCSGSDSHRPLLVSLGSSLEGGLHGGLVGDLGGN